MTALLTLEQPNLQQEFTVDETAIRVEGSSMGLRQGRYRHPDALAVGMLLASGNDAAGARGTHFRQYESLCGGDEPQGRPPWA